MASVELLPPATRFSVCGGYAAIAAMGFAFGVDFPREACRAVKISDHAALWLGPDEWLLIAPDGEAERLMTAMSDALGSEPASLVDISDRQVAIEVSGAKAAEAINAFNALDLHPDQFLVGMCTRTSFGKAEIILWRTRSETFRLEVWRSFAPYVLGCLSEAMREYRRD
jgi:sarcosine oxidase subunit gamma